MKIYHRTRLGFYLTLWHWRIHVTLTREPAKPAPQLLTPFDP